ncbi:phenylalanine--tRNA ligase subunit alpha [Mycoplasma tauri]|uniref:phenylalanine--tRNA ligase subunit alpha n=1 Tax=Mycoplasma tauri TaxID=547987 RepID=UPI0019683426|nr:phenylalanine--tRNA ligase subunit alpha [Mycoplasma tauri]MBZ4204323.1 phenylalanine--tRNA ligase subunit alpha [Mycoplasma tauri]MBZ4212850.1 phenylalanine--tRNA ligase subunit alpha [Mycoplasma tauri]MBZ4218365.1 phenylalanine--tRNA ligase subunit alpha [Mycoplasma tauri]MBZ4226589.1 phenylalanine--tRNA ligase subunit alpha [Mycoplasma tauri]QSB07588.1 phenylalanine--tRNA ligase subunit alpha [Mycoplasma tauri]
MDSNNIKWEEIKTFEQYKKLKNMLSSPESEIEKLKAKIKTSSPQERKEIGIKISELKNFYNLKFAEIEKRIEDEKNNEIINNEFVDVTKPIKQFGSLHPITIVEQRLRDWFTQNGYYETIGGEIIDNEYNFNRLNIPDDHPARAMHDSLYINKELLLRTHNTGITAYELEINANKNINIFAIGKVYRNDEDDATHSHQFTQLDFVSVGTSISFPNLIWTLKSLLSYVLEEEIEVRLRPSYFPFTEPSVEVDINYKGKWMEVLGAGMLHPVVMKKAGYDDKKFNGFAAGIGIERLVMIKYGIRDIRHLYKNDLRALLQFKNEK